jgi:hypothetical protein
MLKKDGLVASLDDIEAEGMTRRSLADMVANAATIAFAGVAFAAITAYFGHLSSIAIPYDFYQGWVGFCAGVGAMTGVWCAWHDL